MYKRTPWVTRKGGAILGFSYLDLNEVLVGALGRFNGSNGGLDLHSRPRVVENDQRRDGPHGAYNAVVQLLANHALRESDAARVGRDDKIARDLEHGQKLLQPALLERVELFLQRLDASRVLFRRHDVANALLLLNVLCAILESTKCRAMTPSRSRETNRVEVVDRENKAGDVSKEPQDATTLGRFVGVKADHFGFAEEDHVVIDKESEHA